jgi:hypothetical protein
MASNFLPAREIVCVSLHKDKRTILAPYAFELPGNETFSQLLENLYIAGVKDKLNTIPGFHPIFWGYLSVTAVFTSTSNAFLG